MKSGHFAKHAIECPAPEGGTCICTPTVFPHPETPNVAAITPERLQVIREYTDKGLGSSLYTYELLAEIDRLTRELVEAKFESQFAMKLKDLGFDQRFLEEYRNQKMRSRELEAENARLRGVLKRLDFADKYSCAENWEYVWKAFDDALPGFRFPAKEKSAGAECMVSTKIPGEEFASYIEEIKTLRKAYEDTRVTVLRWLQIDNPNESIIGACNNRMQEVITLRGYIDDIEAQLKEAHEIIKAREVLFDVQLRDIDQLRQALQDVGLADSWNQAIAISSAALKRQ